MSYSSTDQVQAAVVAITYCLQCPDQPIAHPFNQIQIGTECLFSANQTDAQWIKKLPSVEHKTMQIAQVINR